MKFLPKLLTGSILLAGAFLWATYPDGETPALVRTAPPHVHAITLAPSTGASQNTLPQGPPQSFTETIALIRGKSAQWRHAQSYGIDDQETQKRLAQEMLAMVTDANAVDILHSLSAQELKTPFGIGTLRHAMRIDPVGITNWIASRRDVTMAQTLEVADAWISQPSNRETYIKQLPNTNWKQDFLQSLGSELSTTDPRGAVEVVQQMSPGKSQTYAMQTVVCNWISADPDTALDWVAHVQDPALRDPLIAAAVQSYALTDPAQAATWLVAQVQSPQVADDAALNILKTWVLTDPAQAAGWVAQFPDGITKAAAIQIISQHWQQTNPGAAAAWIQKLAASPN